MLVILQVFSFICKAFALTLNCYNINSIICVGMFTHSIQCVCWRVSDCREILQKTFNELQLLKITVLLVISKIYLPNSCDNAPIYLDHELNKRNFTQLYVSIYYREQNSLLVFLLVMILLSLSKIRYKCLYYNFQSWKQSFAQVCMRLCWHILCFLSLCAVMGNMTEKTLCIINCFGFLMLYSVIFTSWK